ncbi:MAG: DNA-binding response regulator [Spirochaetaceae bacterium]|nr:MAG: DNA-binding response regulator [Spirochaetaceae bacterium]
MPMKPYVFFSNSYVFSQVRCQGRVGYCVIGVITHNRFMNQVVRVFLVEDHPLTSAGIRTVLTRARECTIAAAVASHAQAVEALPHTQADIALLDISLPDRSGLELIEPCIEQGLSVVMLSMHHEISLLSEAFRRGARAYVSKHSAPQTVIRAMHYALRGQRYVCGMAAGVLLDAEKRGPHAKGYPQLTRREAEVAVCIASGRSTTEIAGLLYVSTKTVDSHRLSIFRKLKVSSALQLARYTVAAQIAG